MPSLVTNHSPPCGPRKLVEVSVAFATFDNKQGRSACSETNFGELRQCEVRPQDALLWPLRASITQQALAMDRSHAPRCTVGQIYAVGVRCWAGSTAGNLTSALTLPPECLRSRL